jgi:enoyl-CoA hydratase
MGFVKYELKEQYAIITIDREKALNALNSQVLSDLDEVINGVDLDTVRALIITGAGAKSFVAGADISEMSTLTKEQGEAFGKKGNDLFRKIETFPIPVIAAVNGFALGGGCELSMACDIRLASENAKFGQPEVGLGITPGFSGTQRLPRRVGIAKAKELIYSGKIVDAAEAERIGLVNAVYAPEALMEGAIAMAKSFTANAPIAVKYSKACIDRGMQMDIDDGIALENELFAMCFATADQKEGMGAFLEKRKEKNFKNK